MSNEVRACFVHVAFRRGCPECGALANSIYLSLVNAIRRGVPTPAEQAELDKVRERFTTLGPEDSASSEDLVPVVDGDGLVTRLRARSLSDLLNDVESWVEGEVE